MKKFSRTYTNKLVSFCDRHFTYDRRTMHRETPSEMFDLFAIRKDEDGTNTCVCIHRTYGKIFAYIKKGNKCIYGDYFNSYKDAEAFKRMVLCLG